MTPDLEALVVAAYVFADEYPVPARPGPAVKVADAELVALAVCQAAMGISSDRQFLGLVGWRLPGWFPHLPSQSQYNRRLRSLTGLLTVVQQHLARLLDAGGARLADGTLIGVANYAGCACQERLRRHGRLRLLRRQERVGLGCPLRPAHRPARRPACLYVVARQRARVRTPARPRRGRRNRHRRQGSLGPRLQREDGVRPSSAPDPRRERTAANHGREQRSRQLGS